MDVGHVGHPLIIITLLITHPLMVVSGCRPTTIHWAFTYSLPRSAQGHSCQRSPSVAFGRPSEPKRIVGSRAVESPSVREEEEEEDFGGSNCIVPSGGERGLRERTKSSSQRCGWRGLALLPDSRSRPRPRAVRLKTGAAQGKSQRTVIGFWASSGGATSNPNQIFSPKSDSGHTAMGPKIRVGCDPSMLGGSTL